MSTLGDFFKSKELSHSVPLKGWFVIRLDGKAFHTFTNGSAKPFDSSLSEAMRHTSKQLCAEIQNVKFAYTQSDEISLIMSDLDSDQTSLWYEGDIQKMTSVSASIASAHFNRFYKHSTGKLAYFDSRVFRLENEEEVQDYLLWRQLDSVKNSITLISLKHFSHKEIHGKHSDDKIKMISSKNDSLSNYHQGFVSGFIVKKSYKKIPFHNPKDNSHGMVDRSFWQDETSLNFKIDKFQSLVRKKESS